MKKIFLFAIVALVFSSCANMLLTPEEREIKAQVKNYLKENLHDPSSLKDLKIHYALMTREGLDSLYWAKVEETKNSGERLAYIHGMAGDYLVVIEYRAKNAYGAYRIGYEAFRLTQEFDPKFNTLNPLSEDRSYVINYHAFDWKIIPAK